MRATLDLDDPSLCDVVDAWGLLREFGTGRVFGRVSSSGRGVHLKVHGCEPDVARDLRLVWDDPKRLAFDESTSLKPDQILFSRKGDGTASEWTDEIDELLATYRERAPPAYRRRYLLTAYPVLRGILR